jgi:transposase
MERGRGQTLSHDYKRHGITDLLAALNVAAGEVTVDFRDLHTGEDVLRFFQQIDKTVPRDLEIHVVLEDLSAHKAPVVTSWLERPRKRRWHLHYTPTSSSWLNLAEGWFRELTQRRPRRGSFMSVEHLSDAITLGQPLEQRPQTLRLADPRHRHPRQSPTRPRHPKHQHPFRVRPLRDLLGRPSVPGAISDP